MKVTVDDLIEAKNQLDADLHKLIALRLAKFENDTGLTPDSIYISMVHTSEMGKKRHKNLISAVETTINF